MKILFAGTPENAATVLRNLFSNGIEIAGVLTRQDSKVGRNQVLTPSPVAQASIELGIPTLKANSFNDSVRDWIQEREVDLGIVVAYGAILRQADLQVPRLGWLNLHYSLLPQFPGPAPVQHALMHGLKETGVTVFRLDEGIDTGPIVAQENVSIDDSDTASNLLDRLTGVGSDLLISILDVGEPKILSAISQPKGASFTVATKPNRVMAKLDFDRDATSLRNLIRAFNPEPMAWFQFGEIQVRVLQADVAPVESGLEIGEAELRNSQVVVGCQDSCLILTSVQPAGKRVMPAVDWFRGLRQDRVQFN